VLIDHTNRRVLDVLESREKAAVLAYFQAGLESGIFAELEEVTSDMWDGYVEAAQEVFGQRVRVTIDRFHVMKNFQDCLTAARRQLQRSLPQAAAAALKGTRWLWVTNPENLDADERAQLAALKQQYPQLGALADQREQLRAIFEDRTVVTAEAGRSRLEAWCARARQLGLKAMDKFIKTLGNWMDKIANYFVSRSSNGRTEGFNHGIRAILWRAFGMKNFTHFRLRVLDLFG
jgi:transposase